MKTGAKRLGVAAMAGAWVIASGWEAAAKELGPEQALQRATRALETAAQVNAAQTSRALKAVSRLKSDLQLVTQDQQSAPAYYIFASEGEEGYLVVAGDDCAAPLLGYSTSGELDSDNIPPAMQAWLDEYASQISYARSRADESAYVAANILEGKASIAPLMTTKWDQRDPFNDLCSEMSGKTVVTGCVATAMAQVMKYHNYPENGTQIETYEYNGVTYTADLTQSYYDWASMLDDYSKGYTATEAAAVAKLMYDCGVAVRMQYDENASGAYFVNVFTSLPIDFGYDQNIFQADRNYHGQEDWNELVYDQLSYVGPVIISASTDAGSGHSFVCDGYDTGGYFHINWGWGGSYDGYFLLDALSPEGYGTGGAHGTYNNNVSLLGGIQPPNGEYKRWEVTANSMQVYEGEYAKGSTVTVDINYLYNKTYSNVNLWPGLKITNTETGETTWLEFNIFTPITDGEAYYTLRPNSSLSIPFYLTLPEGLQDGNYSVALAYKNYDTLDWHDVAVEVGNANGFAMAVSGDTVTLSNLSSRAKLSCSYFSADDSFIWGGDFNIDCELVNQGDTEFLGNVRAAIYQGDDLYGKSSSFVVDLAPGESKHLAQPVEFCYEGVYGVPEAGEYSLKLVYEKNGEVVILCNAGTVKVVDSTSLPDISVSFLNVLDDKVYWNGPFWAYVNLVNNGAAGTYKYHLAMYSTIDNGSRWPAWGELVATGPETELTFEAGESKNLYGYDVDFILNNSVSGEIPPTGTYYLTIEDDNHKIAYKYCQFSFVSEEYVYPTKIYIKEGDSFEIPEGGYVTFTVKYEPENTTLQQFRSESHDESVAKVDGPWIDGVAIGETTVTFYWPYDKNISTTINVKVVKAPVYVTKVELDQTELTLKPQDQVKLTATVTPADADDPSITWSSTNEDVATVDENGLVTAIADGSAYINASNASGSFARCHVVVETPYVAIEKIELSQSQAELVRGTDLQLTATVYPENATDKSVYWRTGNQAVATVDNGKVTAVGAGTAEIVAYNGDISASCVVTVVLSDADYTLALSDAALTLKVRDTYQLTAALSPQDDDAEYLWTSSNPEVATVANGLVTAKIGGKATVTVTARGHSASCEVTVEKLAQSIAWDQDFSGITEGDEVTLSASATSGLAVAYEVIQGSDICEIMGSTLIVKSPGDIEIKATQAGDEVWNSADAVTKSFSAIAGIEGISQDKLSITVDGFTLIVNGLSAGETYGVYNSLGILLYRGSAPTWQLQPNTVYIIKARDKVKEFLTR